MKNKCYLRDTKSLQNLENIRIQVEMQYAIIWILLDQYTLILPTSGSRKKLLRHHLDTVGSIYANLPQSNELTRGPSELGQHFRL